MGKSTISINQDFCYSSKVDSTSLSDYQDSLKKFSKNFDKAIKLKLKIPIFLDTNILLRYYSISFAARKQLYDFINENKKRIFLTKQVRYEFLRNREKSISDFFEQATGKIPKDFTDILNKIKNFLGQHKDLLIDYPFVKDGFSQSVSDFGKLLDKLNKKADEKKEENKDLILNDEFIELLNSCVQNEGLNNEEIEFVKKDFNTLTNSLDIDKIDAGLGKPRKAFPGMGDIKIKPEDSYGDFIIYHEMLKYVKNNLKDVIFLTLDNSKGDWMKVDKSPHLHYVENFFLNTSKLIYVVDAERTLEDILKIKLESLVSTETGSVSKIPFKFFDQTPLPSFPAIDDHYYSETLNLLDFSYKILVDPMSEIKHWRFGLKFLRDISSFSALPRHQKGNPLIHLEKNPDSQELKLSYYNVENVNEYNIGLMGNYFNQPVIFRIHSANGNTIVDILNINEKSLLDDPQVIRGFTLCKLVAWADSRNPFEIKVVIERFKS